MPVILRDYQTQAIEGLRQEIRRGNRSIVLVAPTGSGKTTIAGEMIRSASMRDRRILFLAHRKELISQCSHRLADMGVDHGIIRAADPRRRPWLRVHVCSVPTLIRRNPLPPADLIFIDECHRARGASYEQILKQYPRAVCIGLTATPVRSDGRGLGKLFQSMVECPSLGELTEMGHLVPTRVFAPAKPDLTGVHTTAGDYKKDELARAVDKPKLVGDVVAHWLKHAQERLTVVFAVSLAHSRHLRDEFLQAGIAAEHLDGETPERERDAILERLSSGRTRVLCNVGVLTEGWDCPATSCAVLARPTQSQGLYLQMAGRILRPHRGKIDALILDHAGCTLQHGFIDEEREWSLSEDRAPRKRTELDPSEGVRTCLQCFRAFPSRLPACPECGWVFQGRLGEVEVEKGELQEITAPSGAYRCDKCGDIAPAEVGLHNWTHAGCGGKVKRVYKIKKLSEDPEVARLQKIAEERGFRPGWVWFQRKRMRDQEQRRAVGA